MSKECFRCGVRKSIDDFYAHPQMADGHLGKCKECTKLDARSNRVNNREHYREYELARFKTAKRKQNVIELQRRRRLSDTERKDVARQRVRHALNRGSLVRKPCELCGSATTEAHHEDYQKPLDVRWLCRRCHGFIHAPRLLPHYA
jgi:ribosomal protein S27AE